MSLPYDSEAVWIKAKNFINRSFDALDDDDFPRAALWAANSLELLAGSTLCQVNPLLVADPSDNGRSLMLAAGLPEDTTKYRSIPAKALFSRCARAFSPFNFEEAMKIAAQRNAELHSGATPYSENGTGRTLRRSWTIVDALSKTSSEPAVAPMYEHICCGTSKTCSVGSTRSLKQQSSA